MTLDLRDRKGFCIHGHLLMLEDCTACDGLAEVVEAKSYAYAEGAAVAFGLMGMAVAIRRRYAEIAATVGCYCSWPDPEEGVYVPEGEP